MTKNMSRVLYKIGRELVISPASEHYLFKKVYDLNNNQIGRIVRILGPVNHPLGVVRLLPGIEQGHVFDSVEVKGGHNGGKG